MRCVERMQLHHRSTIGDKLVSWVCFVRFNFRVLFCSLYFIKVLSFYFSEIHEAEVQLSDVEVALNDALLPPFSKNDFSAIVRSAINAFEN